MGQSKDILAVRVLEELEAIAMARATDYMAIREGVLDIADTDRLPPGAASAIASVEKTSTGLKLKFYDKLKALELLAKSMGLLDPAAGRPPEDTGLLQAIIESTREEWRLDDLPELQQTAADGDDLVEQTENQGL